MGALLGQYLTFEGDDPRVLVRRIDKAFDLLERGLQL